MHIQSHTHTRKDGTVIDILKLEQVLHNATPKLIDITILKPSRSKKTGFSEKRLKNTDVTKPLILGLNNEIIDGRHRLIKMLESGKKTAMAFVLSNQFLLKCRN